MQRSIVGWAIAAALLASTPKPSHAQAANAADGAEGAAMRPSLALFGQLGLAGVGNEDVVVSTLDQRESRHVAADLDVAYGFGVQFDLPLHPNVSIGVLGRTLWWKGEASPTRALFLDFAFAPRLRYPFASRDLTGAWFVQVPAGIGAFDGLDLSPDQRARLDAFERHFSPVFVLGVDTGVQLLVSEHAGFVLTVGWMHHALSEETTVVAQGQTLSGRAEMRTDELSLQAGVVFAL